MYQADLKLHRFCELGRKAHDLTVPDVRELIALARHVFRRAALSYGVEARHVTAMLTKFCDAGRRSPPTAAFSKVLPGRPQSGEDGNRTKRWFLDPSHKFYATEIPATLVEVKYLLQTLSMEDGPTFPPNTIQLPFLWLTGHEIRPGEYRDPLQLIPINFLAFVQDRRLVQSGHIYPLDRGGRHEPANTFLMLARSNQLQGNNTLPELLALMSDMIDRHENEPSYVQRISPEAHVQGEDE